MKPHHHHNDGTLAEDSQADWAHKVDVATHAHMSHHHHMIDGTSLDLIYCTRDCSDTELIQVTYPTGQTVEFGPRVHQHR